MDLLLESFQLWRFKDNFSFTCNYTKKGLHFQVFYSEFLSIFKKYVFVRYFLTNASADKSQTW